MGMSTNLEPPWGISLLERERGGRQLGLGPNLKRPQGISYLERELEREKER